METTQRLIMCLLFGVLAIQTPYTEAQTGPGAQCICFQEFAPNEEIYQTTIIKPANDGTDRIFVGEQRGIIWIFQPDGSRLPTPFLNMSETQLHISYDTGLFQLEFHPDFVSNKLVYLYYGVKYDDLFYQRLSEWTVSGSDPNLLDPTSERILMDIPYGLEEGTHQGGGMLFGDDGYLYVATGDGKCCGDPLQNGQNKSTIQGSILRIDVDDTTNGPYGIPADNPFLDESDTPPEMYAYGIRQGYTASIDTGDKITGEGKGRIFIGDVGEKDFEEVNLLEAGGNYGWSVWEGNLCHTPGNCNVTDKYVPPIIAYDRSMGGCVLLGGMYRGCENPDLSGWLIFGDYWSSKVYGSLEVGSNVWNTIELPTCTDCSGGLTNQAEESIISLGYDSFGEYYITFVDDPYPDTAITSIYKIVDPNSRGTPC